MSIQIVDFLFVIDDSGHSGSGIVEFQDWGPLGGLLGNTGDILGHEPLVTVSPPGARPGPPRGVFATRPYLPGSELGGACLTIEPAPRGRYSENSIFSPIFSDFLGKVESCQIILLHVTLPGVLLIFVRIRV